MKLSFKSFILYLLSLSLSYIKLFRCSPILKCDDYAKKNRNEKGAYSSSQHFWTGNIISVGRNWFVISSGNNVICWLLYLRRSLCGENNYTCHMSNKSVGRRYLVLQSKSTSDCVFFDSLDDYAKTKRKLWSTFRSPIPSGCLRSPT